MKRYYYVRPVHSVGGLALYPRAPPTESHSRAVAELREALERALYAASSEGVGKTLQEKGVVWWSDYVEHLAHYFRQEPASRMGRWGPLRAARPRRGRGVWASADVPLPIESPLPLPLSLFHTSSLPSALFCPVVDCFDS